AVPVAGASGGRAVGQAKPGPQVRLGLRAAGPPAALRRSGRRTAAVAVGPRDSPGPAPAVIWLALAVPPARWRGIDAAGARRTRCAVREAQPGPQVRLGLRPPLRRAAAASAAGST